MTQKENVVLVGMPASGKTTVGKILAQQLEREFIDTDILIEQRGRKIADIFAKEGEKVFREIETDVIKQASIYTGKIIATGGGAILKSENIKALKQNGIVYYIDRPLEDLVPTSDRPLSNDIASITQRYNERYPIYNAICDVKITVDCSAEQVAKKIAKEFLK